MIELTNSAAQTVLPGQAVTFDTVMLHTGCGECFTKGIPSVKLRAIGGTYKIDFSGNIGSAAANTPVQLAIALGGVPIPATVAVSTPAAENVFNNVSTGTYARNTCCDLNRVSVVNTGTVPVILTANMNLRIARVS